MMWSLTLLVGVQGHGYIEVPKARAISGEHWPPGHLHPYMTEPFSAGAIGEGNIPVCGRDNAGAMTHRFHGADANDNDPITPITPGANYQFTADITAHHMGHMTVRICPFITEDFKQADLAKCHVVQGAPGQTNSNGPFWFLDEGTGKKHWTGVIPAVADLPATSVKGLYTVQWRWNTANSCNPYPEMYECAGISEGQGGWCYGRCEEDRAGVSCSMSDLSDAQLYDGKPGCTEATCCSEVFTNCATVTFEGVAHADPPTVARTTTEPPAAEPESEPTPAPTPTAPLTPCDDSAAADSCTFDQCKAKCQDFCIGHSGGVTTNQGWGNPRFIKCECDDGHIEAYAGCECRHSDCSTQEPTPEPEPTPPAPTPPAPTPPAPTPAAGSTTGSSPTTTSAISEGPCGGECVMNTDCSTNQWCEVKSYVTYCSNHWKLGECPTPFCTRCSAVGSQPPTADPNLAQIHKHTTKFAGAIHAAAKRRTHHTVDVDSVGLLKPLDLDDDA